MRSRRATGRASRAGAFGLLLLAAQLTLPAADAPANGDPSPPAAKPAAPAPAAKPAAPAPETAPAPAPPAPKVDPLPAEQINALVLIEGDRGRGTGFVAKLRGQTFVVTNLHVLSGNKEFTVTGIDGTKYPTTGPLFAAVGHDIAILRVPEARFALEPLSEPNLATKAGDDVTVPGNAAGAGVATQTHGRLQGIGPKLIEVDAKFVKGNSGSPIIHRPTGKVIGVATYTLSYRLDELGAAEKKSAEPVRQTRWFGFRLDSVEKWEQVEWRKFSEEGEQLLEIEEVTDALIAVLQGDRAESLNHAEIRDAYLGFTRDVDNALARNNERAYYTALERFSNRLRAVSDGDLRTFAARKLYSYHADKAREQQQVREAINQALLDMGEVYRAARRSVRN